MADIEFTSLPADQDGYRVIDFIKNPELLDSTQQISVTTSGYSIQCWIYNEKNCYTCSDKKYPEKKWVLPTIGKNITSPYGWRIHPIYGDSRFHFGVDISGKAYSPILAAMNGTVAAAEYEEGGGGYFVTISHDDGIVTKYMHMGPADGSGNKYTHIVKKGQEVHAGQIIGAVGTSGGSTGNHLHFGVTENGRYIDPESRINFSSYTMEDMSVAKLRVQKSIPTYDDFVPLFNSSTAGSFGGGTPHQHMVRRGNMISDCSQYIFDQGKTNKKFGIGSSCIGPMKYSLILHNVPTKDEVEELYKDYTGGFSLPESDDNIDDNSCIKISKYIYSKMTSMYGWSSEATFALLGNMHGESGLNPLRKETGGTGGGLIQWTPWSDFVTKVENNDPNDDPEDIDVQLKYIAKMEKWSNSYSLSRYYNNHMSGYILNINPDEPSKVTIYKYVSKDEYSEESVEADKLWTDYYKGDNSSGERRRVYDELKYYYDRNRILDITADQFKVGKNTIGALTVFYAVNGERPHKYALYPWRRIKAAYTISYYIGSRYDAGVQIALDDNYFSSEVNPYIDNSGSKNNNAYAWAKSMKLLHVTKESDNEYLLCSDPNSNWYDYNIENGNFEYGKIPRESAIACWKYIGNDSNYEETRLAIVDEVLGTDIITISEYPHGGTDAYPKWNTEDKPSMKTIEDAFNGKVTITNPDGNWGQDKDNYKFLGFIYLLDNSETNPSTVSVQQDGSIVIVADSMNKYSTIAFGTTDIKHYNKVRIIYDVNAYTSDSDTTKYNCGINISASHQILCCEDLDENWRTTGFNKSLDYGDTEDLFVYHYPFPMGALQLHNEDLNDIVNKNKKSFDKTFRLTECIIDNKAENPFSIDGYEALNRELPLYISITPISFEDAEKDIPITVEVTIKKIILYR